MTVRRSALDRVYTLTLVRSTWEFRLNQCRSIANHSRDALGDLSCPMALVESGEEHENCG